jgi:putative glutamine amidotransferase
MKFPGWIVIFLIIFGSAFFQADATTRCQTSKTIILGHTYDLNWWMRTRIASSARVMNYKLEFYDLRQAPSIEEGLKKVHAVVFPGGADINPDLYTRDDLPKEFLDTIAQFRSYFNASLEGQIRDPFEYATYKTYYENDEFKELPVLGICRGMQMMAVTKGIPLLQDIRAELGIRNRYNRFDRFFISDKESLMSELFPAGWSRGFKFHHQNPRMDYLTSYQASHPDVKITASSFNGRLVEAIELSDRPALGVQFHPEQSLPRVKHRVFSWLLNQACEQTLKE